MQAEQDALRLQQQAEQEAAMAVALPLRFEQNMAAFRRYIPHIADTYERYQPARPFRFFCNENGQPNLESVSYTHLMEEHDDKPLVVEGREIMHIPFFKLATAFGDLPKEKTYLLYCDRGVMSKLQALYLKEKGFANVKVYRP